MRPSFPARFSATHFGDDTLAVTVFLTSGADDAVITEADVICNTAFRYDSYRGPLQTTAADIHRIFVHEFGHVLGLDHAGTAGGQVIMEPEISDLDHPAADDIAGVRHLYGAEITNLPEPVFLRQDDSFTYSPTANNSPTSYSALYLPPGITIDSASGRLSGTVMAGGSLWYSYYCSWTIGECLWEHQLHRCRL